MNARQTGALVGCHAGKWLRLGHTSVKDLTAPSLNVAVHTEGHAFGILSRTYLSALAIGCACHGRFNRRGRCRLRSAGTELVAERTDADVNFARLSLLGTAACWGTYPVIVKSLAATSGEVLDASLITVVRFTIIAVLCVPLLPADLLTSSPKSKNPTDLGQAAIEIAGIGLAGTLLNTWGIEHTTAIRATLLLSCINIITPVFAFFFGSSVQDRNVSWQTWLSCVVSFLATAYATLGSGEAGSLQQGDLAVVAASFCYALSKVRLAAKLRVFNAETFSAARLLAAAVLVYLIFATECAVGANSNWLAQISSLETNSWSLLFLGALVPGVLATVLQAKGQSIVPPAQAQVIFASVPLFAAFYELVFLQEPIEDREYIAAFVIFAAAAWSSK